MKIKYYMVSGRKEYKYEEYFVKFFTTQKEATDWYDGIEECVSDAELRTIEFSFEGKGRLKHVLVSQLNDAVSIFHEWPHHEDDA